MDLTCKISRSFDNTRSTIFDAALEQANISFNNIRPKQIPTNLNREPIWMRSSRTYSSTIFKPQVNAIPRVNIYKHPDHSAADLFGSVLLKECSKKANSDFNNNNFEPKYTYQSN